MNGVSKQELLSAQYSPVEGFWQRSPLVPGIGSVADGSFKTKQPPAIRGTGYVVDSLEAALWAFYHSEDFKFNLEMMKVTTVLKMTVLDMVGKRRNNVH